MKHKLDFLKDFKKEISKIEGVVTSSSPPRYWISYGSHSLNRIATGSLHRGLPQGRITALAGPSSAGKSFVAANVAKAAQSTGAFVLVVDSENALDDDFMTAVGVDVNDNYSYTSPITIAHCTQIVSSFIRGYREEYKDDLINAPRIVIVIDSLDMLMTDSDRDAYAKGDIKGDQGQHPKQLKAMLRTFVQDIKELNVSMVVTKQVYKASAQQILAGEGLWVINDAIRFACSQILLITRLKLKDETTKEVTGIRMKVEGFKTRFAAPFQTCTIMCPYSTGMDPMSGVFELAESLGVIKKAGSWYTIDGSPEKYRSAEIEKDPSIMQSLIDMCEILSGKSVQLEMDNLVELTTPEASAKSKRTAAYLEAEVQEQ